MRFLREEQALKSVAGSVLQSVKRRSEYQAYRAGPTDQPGSNNTMPILVGAAMIAAAILLSTLISALSQRYIGFETPNEESAWLIDRLTGSVYKCSVPERGKASCEAPEVTTGGILGHGRR